MLTIHITWSYRLPLCTCPSLGSDYPGGSEISKEGIRFPTCSVLTPQWASQSAFLLTSLQRDLANQSLPLLYHSPLPASCPDDVTHHMVFSSIKQEKRFSQWRGDGGQWRLKWGTSWTQKTKALLFLLRVLRVEGGEGGDVRRERGTAALCEANEERPVSRDQPPDSHVLHRRTFDWFMHIYRETHI